MGKLTDRQRKKIIADRVDGLSLRKLANKYHVSPATIHRVLDSDPEMKQKVTHKKEQNTADILSYMESKRDIVCEIIGNGLDVLLNKDKLAEATPAQITTAIGTLIDKWTSISGGPSDSVREDALSRSLKEMAANMTGDEE